MKKGVLEFSYFHSMRAYQLWSILHMDLGKKRDDALERLIRVHPPEKWGMRSFCVLNKYLTCKRETFFTHKMERVVMLLSDLKLNDMHNIIKRCRSFEKKMLKYRKFNEEGSALFGPVDRIRILADEIEHMCGGFKREQAA